MDTPTCPCCKSNDTTTKGWGHECLDCYRWWMTEDDTKAFENAQSEAMVKS